MKKRIIIFTTLIITFFLAIMTSMYLVISNHKYLEESKNVLNEYNKVIALLLENDNGNIALYKYDDSGSKTLVEKTKIRVDSLPKTVQDEIKKGVVMDTEEEAYSRLEDFAS